MSRLSISNNFKIIDFHTHVVPLRKAAGWIRRITSKPIMIKGRPYRVPNYTNGTVEGLLASMRENGIRSSVILPVAINHAHVKSLNDWTKEIVEKHKELIPFGTIHPEMKDYLAEIVRLRNLGFPGIKFHSLFQKFNPLSPQIFEIYNKMAEQGLIAIFDTGDYVGKTELSRELAIKYCLTPKKIARILEKCPTLTLVAAHLGGIDYWDGVEEHLAGKYENLYLDTSFTSQFLPPEQRLRIIRKQGIDKTLFGSDSPWGHQGKEVQKIREFNLTTAEKEKILWKNAEKLLKILDTGNSLIPLEKIAYVIGNERHKGTLYLNITDRCINNCSFCLRKNPSVFSVDLNLHGIEPSVERIWQSIKARGLKNFKELCFCGLGESLLRLDTVLEICQRVKQDYPHIKVRIDTNGQANLIYKKDIVPKLVGLADGVSISLNAENADKYDQLSHSQFGKKAYPAILNFAESCKINDIEVTLTAVTDYPAEIGPKADIKACTRRAQEMGVGFRVRKYVNITPPRGSVSNVFAILSEQKKPLTSQQIAKLVNRPESAIKSDLNTLIRWRLVDKTGRGKDATYEISTLVQNITAEPPYSTKGDKDEKPISPISPEEKRYLAELIKNGRRKGDQFKIQGGR